MTSSDDLFLLIHSMSMAEKRYFKLQAQKHIIGNGNQYLEIFDAVCKQTVYNEESLKQALSSKISTKYFAPKKNYLYNLILNSLHTFYAGSPENILERQMEHIKVLYRKGQFKSCRKMLARTKQQAYDRETFLPLLQLLNHDWNLNRVSAGKRIERERKQILEKINNLFAYQHLLREISDIIGSELLLRDKKRLRLVKKFMKHPLLLNESKALSRHAKGDYFLINGTIQFTLGNTEKGYEFYKNHFLLMETPWGNSNPDNYLAAIANHLLGCKLTQRYAEHGRTLNKLKVLTDKLALGKSKNLFIKAQQIYYMHLFNFYSATGEFKKIISLIPEVDPIFILFKSDFEKQIANNIYWDIAFAYFCLSNYHKSLFWVNKILAIEISENDDLYYAMKMMILIIYFELGKLDLLEYTIKSAYRFFYKRKRLFKIETVLLNYIRYKIPKLRTSAEFIDSLKQLKHEFEIIVKNPLEQKALEFFDYISWMESKIQNRPFAEIVKEKIHLKVVMSSQKK